MRGECLGDGPESFVGLVGSRGGGKESEKVGPGVQAGRDVEERVVDIGSAVVTAAVAVCLVAWSTIVLVVEKRKGDVGGEAEGFTDWYLLEYSRLVPMG